MNIDIFPGVVPLITRYPFGNGIDIGPVPFNIVHALNILCFCSKWPKLYKRQLGYITIDLVSSNRSSVLYLVNNSVRIYLGSDLGSPCMAGSVDTTPVQSITVNQQHINRRQVKQNGKGSRWTACFIKCITMLNWYILCMYDTLTVYIKYNSEYTFWFIW